MDKQQELTKKVYNAINDTLGKEDVTTEEGINAMMSAVLRIVYGCAVAMQKIQHGRKRISPLMSLTRL